MAIIRQFRGRWLAGWAALAVFNIATFSLIGCTSSPTSASTPGSADAGGATQSAATRDGLTNAPVRDLRQDEADGGHILRKHVGQTEAQLRERLERDRGITGASTFTDEVTADRVVGATIAQSQSQIEGWLGQERHPNLVLDYDGTSPIGRTMNRGEFHSHVCEHAIVVLKYGGPNRYYVLTSYPECRS